MNKVLLFLLFFAAVSCNKEPKKKIVAPTPAPIPVIVVEGKSVVIDSLLLKPFDSKVLKEFYLASGYKSVWQSKKDRATIVEQLSNSEEEGLNSANYKVRKLQKYENKYATLNDKERANYDILLTHSLQKYISQLSNGQINPRNFYKDWDLKDNAIDINETIAFMLKSDSLEHKIERLKPTHAVCKSLVNALKIINSFPQDDFLAIEIVSKIVLNDTIPSLTDIKKRLIY